MNISHLWRIEATGAVTAVGTRCWQSAASWVSETRRYRRQVVELVGRNPITTASCEEVAQGRQGVERLARLLAVALVDLLTECEELVKKEEIPALVALALPQSLDAKSADQVWQSTMGQLTQFGFGGVLDDVHCFLFLHGPVGGMRALGALFEKEMELGCTAILAGVDSLVDLSRLQSDYGADRLMTRDNKEGWIAGEAASALLLRCVPDTRNSNSRQWVFHRPASVEGLTVHNGGAAQAPAAAMALALQRSLANAEWTNNEVDTLMSDHDGSRWRAQVHAQSRAQVEGFLSGFEWLPASVTGQVGAATAPLHWALAAMRLKVDESPPNSVLSTVLDDGLWAGSVAMERTLAR